MTAAVAVACILAALLAEGNSLSCQVCSSSGTFCEGVLTSCDASANTCITTITQFTFGGEMSSTVTRDCGKSSSCNKIASLSNTEIAVKYSAGCCAKDGCTPVVPPLPSSSTSTNGVICPACQTATSSDCYTSDTVMCTGEEKKCIRIAFKKTGSETSTFALRGCATQSFCGAGSNSITDGGITQTTESTCTGSSIRLEHGVFLPVIAVLLLLKTVL